MKRAILIITFVVTLLSCKAQSLMPDIHRLDSVMNVLKLRFGNKKPWRNVNQQDSTRSVVLLKPKVHLINPGATSLPKTLDAWRPNSVFSYKDNMMWARDYNMTTFLSDMLIGW